MNFTLTSQNIMRALSADSNLNLCVGISLTKHKKSSISLSKYTPKLFFILMLYSSNGFLLILDHIVIRASLQILLNKILKSIKI